MEFATKTGLPGTIKTPCLVTGVFEGSTLSDSAGQLDTASKGALAAALRRGDMTGKHGESIVLYDVAGLGADRLVLIGLGPTKSFDEAKFQNAIGSLALRLKQLNIDSAVLCLLDLEVKDRNAAWKARQIAGLLDSGFYSFTEMKSKKPPEPSLSKVLLRVENRAEQKLINAALKQSMAINLGVKTAKDIANTPPNICTPTYMARESRKLARNSDRITTSVLEEKDMKRLGMGALLSVSQGSAQPAKLIAMEYRGAAKSVQPYVLIGKGITFDTGGISLKAGPGMHEMTYDMCGAASILGTMTALAKLALPINAVGIIAAAENMPSSTASRPGDIVTTMSGLTVEIQNTDAEGRLVLCDALTYAAKYKPKTVIDVATLTGAIVIALGKHASGLFSNDDSLSGELEAAANYTADRIWRLPIWDDYQAQLKTPLADLRNIGGREAGSITAACFLARFTNAYHWAHLDVAGTAYNSTPMGATGRPVTLLTQYLIDRSTAS